MELEEWKPNQDEDSKKSPIIDLPKQQYTVSEILDSDDLKNYSYLILLSLVYLLISLNKVKFLTSTTEESIHVSDSYTGAIEFTTSCSNLTKKNRLAFFEFVLVPKRDAEEVKVTWNVKVDSMHYGDNNTFLFYRENRIWHDFSATETMIPLHYTSTDNVRSVTLNVKANPDMQDDRSWLEDIKLKCFRGNSMSFDISYAFHCILFAVYIVCTIFFYMKNIPRNKFVRSKLEMLTLPFGILSQAPFEFLGMSYHISDFMRDLFHTIVFCLVFLQNTLKVYEYNVQSFANNNTVKHILSFIFMFLYCIYHTCEIHIQLWSIPSTPNSSDPNAGDFMTKNFYECVIGFAYYHFCVKFFDKADKKDGEESNHFSADIYPFAIASAVTGLLYMPNIRRKNVINDPYRKCVRFIGWDFCVWYEAFVSIQQKDTPLTNDEDSPENVGVDVDESLNPIIPEQTKESSHEDKDKENIEESTKDSSKDKQEQEENAADNEQKKKKKVKKIIIVKKKKHNDQKN